MGYEYSRYAELDWYDGYHEKYILKDELDDVIDGAGRRLEEILDLLYGEGFDADKFQDELEELLCFFDLQLPTTPLKVKGI